MPDGPYCSFCCTLCFSSSPYKIHQSLTRKKLWISWIDLRRKIMKFRGGSIHVSPTGCGGKYCKICQSVANWNFVNLSQNKTANLSIGCRKILQKFDRKKGELKQTSSKHVFWQHARVFIISPQSSPFVLESTLDLHIHKVIGIKLWWPVFLIWCLPLDFKIYSYIISMTNSSKAYPHTHKKKMIEYYNKNY